MPLKHRTTPLRHYIRHSELIRTDTTNEMLCIVHETKHFGRHKMDTDDKPRGKKIQTTDEKQATIDTIEVHDNDVLGGRGNGVAAHPGNMLLRDICIRYQQAYADAKRNEKMKVAKLAISHITSQSPPGRFLEKSPVDNEKWVLMNPKRVLEKVSQALRDRKLIEDSSPSSSISSPLLSGSFGMDVDRTPVEFDHASTLGGGGGAGSVAIAARQLQQAQLLSSYLALSLQQEGTAGAATSMNVPVPPLPLPPHVLSGYPLSESNIGMPSFASSQQRMQQAHPVFTSAQEEEALIQEILQRRMTPEEQFEDAVDDKSFNTSMEIFMIANHRGYLSGC